MLIVRPCVVTLTWNLADAQGQPLEALPEPTEFFYGGEDLLPRVQEALAGLAPGAVLDLHLEPEDAFGEYDCTLVCFEPRALFPEGVEPGMRFEGLPEGAITPGMPEDAIFTVTELYPEHVVLDANHPLAGMALRLHLRVVDVRQATEEEIRAGTLRATELSTLHDPVDRGALH